MTANITILCSALNWKPKLKKIITVCVAFDKACWLDSLEGVSTPSSAVLWVMSVGFATSLWQRWTKLKLVSHLLCSWPNATSFNCVITSYIFRIVRIPPCVDVVWIAMRCVVMTWLRPWIHTRSTQYLHGPLSTYTVHSVHTRSTQYIHGPLSTHTVHSVHTRSTQYTHGPLSTYTVHSVHTRSNQSTYITFTIHSQSTHVLLMVHSQYIHGPHSPLELHSRFTHFHPQYVHDALTVGSRSVQRTRIVHSP